MNHKKTALALALASSLITFNSTADESTDREKSVKQVGAFSAPTIAGAMIGGPVGMIMGAVSGIFLSELTGKEHDQEVLANIAREEQLAAIAAAQAELEKAQRLQDPILFDSDSDNLNSDGLEQLAQVADYLFANPEKFVSLNAFADPIGSKKYNQVLSEKRALKVAETLKSFGVDSNQIESYSHGENSAITDTNLFAFERRVDIEIKDAQHTFALTE